MHATMKHHNRTYSLGLLLLAIITLASCQDGWDDHYNQEVVGKSTLSLFDYIASQDDLTTFAGMLAATGYDTLLNAGQVYTVWAPTDEALTHVTITDPVKLKLFVESHISWFSHPVREANNKTIITVNNKRLLFKMNEGGFLYDDRPILRTDAAVKNGIVHVLDGYVPYRLNVWEYMLQTTGIDSMQAYVNSLFEYELDGEASFDSNGILVDSIFKITNPFLTFLGALDDEDSTYTVIIPDNQAWIEGLNLTKSYFRTLPAQGGEVTQTYNAKWTLVKDFVCRGRQKSPFTLPVLTSTYGNELGHPDSLYKDMSLTELSNGYVYTTTHFPFNPSISWHKPIRIEAEDPQNNGRVPNNYTIVNTSSVGTGLDVSNGTYITCIPKSNTSVSKLFVRFPIPNTLSATYNIYAVFVPSSVINKSDTRPYKLDCYISYVNESGREIKDSRLLSKVVTDTTAMTKLLVAENWSFPYSNIVDEPGLLGSEKTTVSLNIMNAAGVSAQELASFNRTIRIDCIILEPVQ